MEEKVSKVTLVGGQSHGLELEVSDSIDSVDVPVYKDIEDRVMTNFSDTYTRRELTSEFSSDKWVYFGHSGDDDTETETLARYLREALTKGPTP